MGPPKFIARLLLALWLLPAFAADNFAFMLPIGTPVVVVVGEFLPTKMDPADSGYSKPLVIHPGKRGIVVGLDAARKDLVIVEWEEQYWQEWTQPTVDEYVDSSRTFMSQTGKWIKWKRFTSAINIDNLTRPISSPRDRAR